MATSTTGKRNAAATYLADAAILDLLPAQGEWSETAYLWLSGQTNRLVELNDGRIEVLPMPTKRHQAICRYLFLALLSLMQRIGGDVFFAPLRLRIGPGKFREPDLLLVSSADDPRARNEFWEGADMVVEVVSPDAPSRDYIDKRADYAEAGVLEYWIVDPQNETITVLQLMHDAYLEHGVFGSGTTASSALSPDFRVAVDAVFDPA